MNRPPHTLYDPNRRVPFFSNPAYVRDEYDWWVKNTGQPSQLWLNGNLVYQEEGTFDIRLLDAWGIQPRATGTIGVIDNPGNHGSRIFNLLQVVAPGSLVLNYPVNPYYSIEDISAGINKLVLDGVKIIVLPWGTWESSPLLLAACQDAQSKGVILCGSLPNVEQSIQEVPDYPALWALPNFLAVSSLDRAGQHYNPSGFGIAGIVSAPGRNILAAGTYSSGTSYAAPIVAGVVALMLTRFPDANFFDICQHLRNMGTLDAYAALKFSKAA